MFHNYIGLISRHKRSFSIQKYAGDVRSGISTRFGGGSYGTAVECEGVFETVTKKDYNRYPDMEVIKSDMKLITSPDLLNGFDIQPKDRITYQGKNYWVYKIVDKAYYGNFYVIVLTKDWFN